MGTAVAAQESGSYIGFNVSEPYSSTAFGFDGRWQFGDGLWAVSGFGSAFTVGDVSSGAWLGEALVTRALGSGLVTRNLYVGTGIRFNGTPGVPTEFAVPLVVGFNAPVIQAAGWDIGVFGHLGIARRQADHQSVFARTNRIGIEVGRGPFRFSISHDDAAGSNSPFNYGGAARISFGFRVR
jgi:hypothetical protein